MGRVTWVAAVWWGDEVGWNWWLVPWRGKDSTEKLPSTPGAPNQGLGRTETLSCLQSPLLLKGQEVGWKQIMDANRIITNN